MPHAYTHCPPNRGKANYYAVSNTVLGAGQLKSIDGPFANDTISYTYDTLGRVKSRAIDGVAEQATYDALGRVTNLVNILGSFTHAYVNQTFRLSSVTYPNNQTTTFSYYGNTNDQRLETIWHKTSGGSTISKFDYTYDADGQIKTWTQQADAGTPKVHVFDYDNADQLLGAAKLPWMTKGARGDWKWLKGNPSQRMRADKDNMMLSSTRYGSVKDMPAGQRGLQYTKDWRWSWAAFREGAGSAMRFIWWFAPAGEGVFGKTPVGN